MQQRINRFLWLALCALYLVPGLAMSDQRSVWVNLTSDDTKRAAMAVSLAHSVMKRKETPVTIFLNVDGVRLADRNIPQHLHPNGKSVQEMLQAFMKDGGKVLICPMCMKNVAGMDEMDLIDGVEQGGPQNALVSDGVTFISY
jgi:predicted peroxiredoxin